MAPTGQGSATKAAKASLVDLENMLSDNPSCDRVCLKLAQVLRVRRSEVALLRLEKAVCALFSRRNCDRPAFYR